MKHPLIHHVSLIAEFIPMAGSVSAALALSYLYWWFKEEPTRLRVKREGRLWLARNNREWFVETGLSRSAMRTATKRLEALGLIERKVWKFDAEPTVHYWLDMQELTNRLASSGQSITVTIEDVLLVTNKTQLLSDTFVSQKSSESGDAEKTMGKQTALEVLEAMKKRIDASPSKPQKATAKSLSMYWQRLVPKHFDIGMQKPHTMRELGMLAQYAKLTQTHAVDAMHWAIENWAKFRYRAEEQLGEKVPATPRVGALLKCCVVAVEGYQKATAKVDFTPVVHSSAQVVMKEKSPKATDAEIEAMLKDVEDHEK